LDSTSPGHLSQPEFFEEKNQKRRSIYMESASMDMQILWKSEPTRFRPVHNMPSHTTFQLRG
jgi:hypothetical protein